MSGGWRNVQYDYGNLHGKLGKGESMVHGYGKCEDPKVHSVAGSAQNVDARLHNLSRRSELRYLTVQVGRVAKAELDAYRKKQGACNA